MLSWSDEMDSMLGVLNRQVKASLNNIKMAFQRDGLSFNGEFKQYFLRVSNNQIKDTYDQFEINSMLNDKFHVGVYGNLFDDFLLSSSIHTASHGWNNTQQDINGPVEIIDSSDEEDEARGHVKSESLESVIQYNDHDIQPQLNDDVGTDEDGGSAEFDVTEMEVNDDNPVNVHRDTNNLKYNHTDNGLVVVDHKMTGRQMKYLKAIDGPRSNTKLVANKATISSNQLKMKKRFKCDICFKEFTILRSMKRHKMTHTDEIPFHCRGCFTGFSQEIDQVTHEKVCKYRRYECHICKKCVTADKNDFKRHMRTHNGEKPFRCEICMADFTQKNNLKRHLDVIHTNC